MADVLDNIPDDELTTLLHQQLGDSEQAKKLRDLMLADVTKYPAPAPLEATIAPNPQAQQREAMLQKLLTQSQADPTTQLLERLKRVSGGAENEQQYVDQRFAKQYGSSKLAHAANFLSDVLRTSTGKETLLEKVQGTAGSEFKNMLSEASQGLQQERAQNAQTTQLLTQLRGYDKQDQDRKVEEARLGVKGRAQDIQSQYQKTLAAIQAAKAGDASANGLRDDILAWTQQRFGKTPEEQDWKGVYDDLVRNGMGEGEAHLKTQALKAAFKLAGQRPISTGTSRETTSQLDEKGNVVGQVSTTARQFDRPLQSGNILQSVLGGKGSGAMLGPGADILAQLKGQVQVPTQATPQAPTQAPRLPAYPGGVSPTADTLNRVFKGNPKYAEQYTSARISADKQFELASDIIRAGITPNDKGLPGASSWTGPIMGSDIGTSVRQALGTVDSTEALTKINQTMIPFATAREAVGGRVAVWDAQAAMKAKPAAWQKYRNQLVLAVANSIRADYDTEKKVPGDKTIPQRLSPEQEDKIAGEIIRIMDGVGTITKGFDLSKPLDAAASAKMKDTLQIRKIRDILQEPTYQYDKKNIPGAARKVIPARQ